MSKPIPMFEQFFEKYKEQKQINENIDALTHVPMNKLQEVCSYMDGCTKTLGNYTYEINEEKNCVAVECNVMTNHFSTDEQAAKTRFAFDANEWMVAEKGTECNSVIHTCVENDMKGLPEGACIENKTCNVETFTIGFDVC